MDADAKTYYLKKLLELPDHAVRMAPHAFLETIENVKKIHLTGVCGTAMGSLAGLFKEAGYIVSGSDEKCYPPMSDFIEANNISFFEGFSCAHTVDADLCIIANMFGPDNPEAVCVREKLLPTLSMPDAIRKFFIKDRKSLVVTGTHGKTTTTGLLEHVFSVCGKNPGFMVGGVPQGSEKSYAVGTGDYFIIEGDEYDTSYFDKSPKFLHYAPYVAIVTSVELDHVDIYKNIKDYEQAFTFLAESMAPNGALVLCSESIGALKLRNATKAEVITYGFTNASTIYASAVSTNKDGQCANVFMHNTLLGTMTVPLFGKYNLLNALAVVAVALREGIDFIDIADALKSFKGMKRRQEIIGVVNGITVIDDFAHHPTAVRETLAGIRDRFPDRRIIALFEPRSNSSRSKLFENSYIESFDTANMVIISEPKAKAGYNPEQFLDLEKVVTLLNKKKEAYTAKNSADIIKIIKQIATQHDVIVVMSNGSFDGIHQKILATLKDI